MMSFYRGMTCPAITPDLTCKFLTFVKMIRPERIERGNLWNKVIFDAGSWLVIFPDTIFVVATRSRVLVLTWIQLDSLQYLRALREGRRLNWTSKRSV